MLPADGPPSPRSVTPARRLGPFAIVLAVALVLGGAGLVRSGLRSPDAPATGTATMVAHHQGVQLIAVVDGPQPGRHVVTWADDIPTGTAFRVGLGGECGCQPRPATLVGAHRTPIRVALVPLGGLMVGAGALAAGRAAQVRQRSRRGQRRARAVVGTGEGPLVHVLPSWVEPGPSVHAELWLVGAGEPLGRVPLGRTDQGFDPTQPFRAWGPLTRGGPVALTSADGRQLVLPHGALEPPPPLGPPGHVGIAVIQLLGWPSRLGPGELGRAAAADAAATTVQTRTRWFAALLVAATLALGFLLAGPVELSGPLLLAVVAGALATAIGPFVAISRIQAPVRDLLRPIVGADRPHLLAKATRAVLVARRVPASRTGVDRAHGRAPVADGSGWMPPPHLPRPR